MRSFSLVLVAASACAANEEDPLPPATGFGSGAVVLTALYEPDMPREPVDLAFHPERHEIWAVHYKDDTVLIGYGPGTPDALWRVRGDPASRHFMNRPPAIAMGAANTWATCTDNDGTQSGNSQYFTGPSLFSADPAVFGIRTPTGLGSHLDMLHSTPYCRGIAHEVDNVYWVFNAHDRSLDRYDFRIDHGPGNDDHSDGEIRRYAAGELLGVDGLPSHVFFHEGKLYVADTGHQRVVALDTRVGQQGAELPRPNERAARFEYTGWKLDVVVPPGTLQEPVGIEVRGEVIYVSDAATSRFYAFDRRGRFIKSVDTGLPPRSLAGFTFGPDGRIHFVDRVSGRVLRLDPS